MGGLLWADCVVGLWGVCSGRGILQFLQAARTFTDDLAAGIRHLLDTGAPHGTYNLTGSGQPSTWADIAAQVFDITGNDPARITGISTDEYFASSTDPVAPRPRNSTLDLAKIRNTGYAPADWNESLRRYLAGES